MKTDLTCWATVRCLTLTRWAGGANWGVGQPACLWLTRITTGALPYPARPQSPITIYARQLGGYIYGTVLCWTSFVCWLALCYRMLWGTWFGSGVTRDVKLPRLQHSSHIDDSLQRFPLLIYFFAPFSPSSSSSLGVGWFPRSPLWMRATYHLTPRRITQTALHWQFANINCMIMQFTLEKIASGNGRAEKESAIWCCTLHHPGKAPPIRTLMEKTNLSFFCDFHGI